MPDWSTKFFLYRSGYIFPSFYDVFFSSVFLIFARSLFVQAPIQPKFQRQLMEHVRNERKKTSFLFYLSRQNVMGLGKMPVKTQNSSLIQKAFVFDLTLNHHLDLNQIILPNYF